MTNLTFISEEQFALIDDEIELFDEILELAKLRHNAKTRADWSTVLGTARDLARECLVSDKAINPVVAEIAQQARNSLGI